MKGQKKSFTCVFYYFFFWCYNNFHQKVQIKQNIIVNRLSFFSIFLLLSLYIEAIKRSTHTSSFLYFHHLCFWLIIFVVASSVYLLKTRWLCFFFHMHILGGFYFNKIHWWGTLLQVGEKRKKKFYTCFIVKWSLLLCTLIFFYSSSSSSLCKDLPIRCILSVDSL